MQVRFYYKKNLDLHLRSLDADLFLFEEKFKSTSNEDTDPFLFEEKFRSFI